MQPNGLLIILIILQDYHVESEWDNEPFFQPTESLSQLLRF
jgi:hypothetical protein